MTDLPLTERANPSTTDLDRLSTHDLLHRMNDEDRRVAWAVEREIGAIAAAVDAIAERLKGGGRLHYFGAGSSGRIGVLDASEIPPTFSAPPDLVVGHIAGGWPALTSAVESAEDDEQAGAEEVIAAGVCSRDAVVGVSAGGTTPYVVGAMRAANAAGALTVALVSAADSPVTAIANLSIVPATGPEVLTGSTRLKAGTAQKLVLNMLSTAVMVKLGKVHGNLMVDLQAGNAKLRARAERLVLQLSSASSGEARAALEASGWRVKPAVLQLVHGCSAEEATLRLERTGGSLRAALDEGH